MGGGGVLLCDPVVLVVAEFDSDVGCVLFLCSGVFRGLFNSCSGGVRGSLFCLCCGWCVPVLVDQPGFMKEAGGVVPVLPTCPGYLVWFRVTFVLTQALHHSLHATRMKRSGG